MPVDPEDVISRTIWGEARGTGAAGMRHVASVIMNRVRNPNRWGDGIVHICWAPNQFQCWNPGSSSLDKVKKVTVADPWFLMASGIARAAVAGNLVDETNGADSFYAISMVQPPAWTKRARHTYSDGWHSFWKIGRIESSLEETGTSTVSLCSIDSAPARIF
jgi:N-acetylmuramoyl-L-alanine amidase